MKKLIILIFIFGFNQVTKAQDKSLSVGLGGSFDKRLNDYSENPWFGFDHQFSDISEFSFGIQFNYQFNEKIGLRSGISYSRKGYKLIYAWITPNGIDGSGDPSIPLESKFRLNYIDIPFGIYYQVVTNNRYTLSPSIGIMNSINIGESEISEMGDGTTNQTNFNSFNTKPYVLGARLGLINNFNLSDKVFISLEPYVMYNFSKLNDTDINKSDLTFGGCLSVNYKFNHK
jgi:hypothetical protein